MIIQLLRNHFDQMPQESILTWPELVEIFTGPPLPRPANDQNRLAWIPADMKQRGNENVKSISMLVLDFDGPKSADGMSVAEWAEARGRLEGISHIWHSTRSHLPIDGNLRYRVIVQLSRPVPAKDWRKFWAACAQMFGSSTADPKCKNEERLFYLPTETDAAYESGVGEGEPLGVDEVLISLARVETQTLANRHIGRKILESDLVRVAKTKATGEFDTLGKTTLQRLLARERPYAESGNRDNALYALAMFVARRISELYEPSGIVDLLGPEIDFAYTDDPDAPRSWLLADKLERAWAELHQQRDGIDAVRLAQLNRQGPYTTLEIDRFVGEQQLSTPEALAAQLLIKHRTNMYVFREGDYVYAGTDDSGEDYCRQQLALCGNLGCVVQEICMKGGVKDKGFKVLKKQHGFAVRNVKPSLAIRTSYVEFSTETLWHAICPRRLDLVAVYDPDIEAWLESWGDETLLDWLATAPKLEKATAALFLHGGPKSGKSMLARGLGAVWGSAPTKMSNLGVNFNDAVAKNPCVLADESLPEIFRKDSGLLRELITAHSISLNRKYMEPVDMHGSVRVIIAKNNLTLFAPETMSRDDVNAVCQRLLYYRMPDKQAPYFNPPRLAQHILWLEETRTVQAGTNDRLWVEGRDSALHRNMRISSRDRSLVCQWLMNFLLNPSPVSDLSRTMFKFDSEMLVNPRMVYDRFEQYLGKERNPGLNAICRVFDELATKRARGLYCVSLEDLVQWGESHSYAYSRGELELLIEQAGARVQLNAN